MIVDNMTGAGSRLTANFLYKASTPDGLTIGNFIGSLLLQQILGDSGVEFDGKRFRMARRAGAGRNGLRADQGKRRHQSGSMDGVLERPIKLGGEAPGANDSDVPRMLQATLKLPMQLIEGYKGAHRSFASPPKAAKSTADAGPGRRFVPPGKKASTRAKVTPIIQVNAKKAPDIPHVPNAIDHAKTAEAKALLEAGVHAPSAILRAYALPPNTPKDRLNILREAFNATMKDAEFLAEMKKSKARDQCAVRRRSRRHRQKTVPDGCQERRQRSAMFLVPKN